MDIQLLAQQFYAYSRYIRNYSNETIRRYRFIINYYCRFNNISDIKQAFDDSVRSLFYYGRTSRNWSFQTFITFLKSLSVFFQ